ncbi:MAG: ABC transporter substrate-binding protein [Bacteroidota bacterium]
MRVIAFFCLLLCGSILFAQPLPPEDPEAIQWLQKGKMHLEDKAYDLALRSFEQALNRPEHQASSAALYLTGLAHYYLEDWEAAIDRFGLLARQFPDSRYLPDALYHRSLLLIQANQSKRQRRGVNDLLYLSRHPDSSLAYQALQAVRKFMFQDMEYSLLRQMSRKADDEHRLLFLQARCYRLVEDNSRSLALLLYEDYLNDGYPSDAFITRLLDERQRIKYTENEIVKVALFLPLHLAPNTYAFPDSFGADSLPPIPRKSRLALDFYEGFQLAAQQYLPYANKRFFIQVFDTQRDSLITERSLYQLDSLRPDLVVGEIYNNQSEVLAQWCERNATPLIIPLSPTSSLTSNRSFVFLAHPSAGGHGHYMAQYARNQLRLNRTVVWTDQRAQSEQLANAFLATFDTLGGEVIRIPVDSVFDDTARMDISDVIRSLRYQKIDGVYLPIQGNQEVAGFILSQMQMQGLEVKVMGGPHWYQRYKNIDRQLKDYYQVMFSTSFMPDKQDPEYSAFFTEYLKAYQYPPNTYNIHGYDLGMFLLQTLDSYNYFLGKSLSGFLRESPSYQGIHISYHFQDHQQNQFVNIGGYKDGRMIKINAPSRIDLDVLFPSEE